MLGDLSNVYWAVADLAHKSAGLKDLRTAEVDTAKGQLQNSTKRHRSLPASTGLPLTQVYSSARLGPLGVTT